MASRVVLVRHAKAQAYAPSGADADRELTDAGRRSCKAAFGAVASQLKDAWTAGEDGVPLTWPEGVHLWTSPAARAFQTAHILAKACGFPVKRIEEHPSLYADDPAPFLAEVAAVQGTVVAVGHNPFLEDLASALTGSAVRLEKGAVLALDTAQVPAGVEWFAQGPQHRRWRTLAKMEDDFAAAAARVEENASWLVADPGDPEALHQYRVSLRVARSLAAFVGPYCKRGYIHDLGGALKGLQAQTSRLREYDVMHGMLADPESASRYADAAELLGRLEPVRDAERARFNKYFAKHGTRKEVQRAISLLGDITWSGRVEACGMATTDVAARFDALGAAYERDLSACDFGDHDATHSIRKRSKQRRYVARELGDVLGEERAKAALTAEATQNLLGKLCDARVNRAIALELLPEPAPAIAFLNASDDPDALPSFADAQRATEEAILAELGVAR